MYKKLKKKTTCTVYIYFLSAADGKGGLQIWEVDANTLNTKSMAATWRSFSLEVGGKKQTIAVVNEYTGKSAWQLWKPLLCEVSVKYWRDHSPFVFLKTLTQGLEWQNTLQWLLQFIYNCKKKKHCIFKTYSVVACYDTMTVNINGQTGINMHSQ